MKRIAFRLALYSGLVVITMACQNTEKSVAPVRPVKVEKIESKAVDGEKLVLPASVNEFQETKLSFRVGGPLIKLNDVIGSYVQAGEVIAQIDPRDFKIAFDATESRYKLAKAEFERYKSLAEQGSVSKSVFDQTETSYKLAKNNYESAKNALEDTELKAPFSGYINGVFANNFEEVVPGAPIISLLDMSKYEVNAWISLKDAALINPETEFYCVVTKGGKEYRIPGRLKEIGNKTSVSKQALPITVVINAKKDIGLHAGMATYLEIGSRSAEPANDIYVSVSAVFTKDNQTRVWVYDEASNTVSSKEVTTGELKDNGVIEIKKGLAGNESIVTAGANYLFEGQKVKKLQAFSKSNVGNKL
ncbi:efflux RND transporter periplasmic adaptor subunit [Mangrovibacterium diazotrophicum]|uniref:RND family efflux transporter MFP subunit n=1 Tax=Mangrovibacterium diazotrophicum TaxID=1261403 RepID=A0A419W4K3_9BACT|nr:efflux RND transporter periplasmic adaptor subunit [Mangrovibacterium diazotrophicum]RKD90360.1 RND family efflux transporter MFP subunit [Mangrovibacterium diazotrophicum]